MRGKKQSITRAEQQQQQRQQQRQRQRQRQRQQRTLKGLTRGSGESSPVMMLAQRPSLHGRREQAARVNRPCSGGVE